MSHLEKIFKNIQNRENLINWIKEELKLNDRFISNSQFTSLNKRSLIDYYIQSSTNEGLRNEQVFYNYINDLFSNNSYELKELYQAICDNLCPSFESAINCSEKIEKIFSKKSIYQVFEDLNDSSAKYLINTIENQKDSDDEESLKYCITQIRKSCGIAQLQFVFFDISKQGNVYLNALDQERNQLLFPSYRLDYNAINDTNIWSYHQNIDNYILEFIKTIKTYQNYNELIKNAIHKIFIEDSPVCILQDGEITFWCILFIMANVRNSFKNHINFLEWINNGNMSIKPIQLIYPNQIRGTFNNIVKRIFGNMDLNNPRAVSFKRWMINEGSKTDDKNSFILPLSSTNGDGYTANKFFKSLFDNNYILQDERLKIDEIKEIILNLVKSTRWEFEPNTFLSTIERDSPFISVQLEEFIRKEEILPRALALFPVVPHISQQKKEREPAIIAICTLQGHFLENDSIEDIRMSIEGRIQIFKIAFEPIFRILIGTILENAFKEVINNSKKTAIAAIMSRNMSHNIGSHVLFKLSQGFVEARHDLFYGYLQRRMEFIAEISTYSSPFTATKKICSDILCGFSKVDLMVGKVSGIENIDNEKIKIIFNGNTCVIKNHEKCIPKIDILIEVPSDIVGLHAFYIILENIIRNSAKHSNISNDLQLKIIIDEHNDDYYKVKIIDNLGTLENRNKRLDLNPINQLKKNSLNKVTSVPIIDKLNNLIKLPILSNGQLRNEAWGILEMKICAAYLRQESLADQEESCIKDMPYLCCSFYDNLQNKSQLNNEGSYDYWNLGYEFFMLKPKLVQILLNKDNVNFDKEILRGLGIDIVYKNKEPQLYNHIINYGTRHDFLIIEGSSYPINNNQRLIFCSKQRIHNLLRTGNDREKLYYDLLAMYLSEFNIKNINIDTNENKQEKYHLKIEYNGKILIFDDHDRSAKNYLTNTPNLVYYQYFGSGSRFNDIVADLRSPKSSEVLKNAIKLRILNAALSKIAIIDERIQAELPYVTSDIFKSLYGGKELGDDCLEIKNEAISKLLKLMNLFIPSKHGNTNLMIQSFNENVRESINSYIESLPKDTDYLVIHLGIIEKLQDGTSVGDVRNWLLERRKKINEVNNSGIKIIIISGRGKPSNMPEEELFLPFSVVQQHLIPFYASGNKSKLLETLNKARKYERK